MIDMSTYIVFLIVAIAISFLLNHLDKGNFFTLFDWLFINVSLLVYAELLPFFMFIMFLIIDCTFSIYSMFKSPNESKEVDSFE